MLRIQNSDSFSTAFSLQYLPSLRFVRVLRHYAYILIISLRIVSYYQLQRDWDSLVWLHIPKHTTSALANANKGVFEQTDLAITY